MDLDFLSPSVSVRPSCNSSTWICFSYYTLISFGESFLLCIRNTGAIKLSKRCWAGEHPWKSSLCSEARSHLVRWSLGEIPVTLPRHLQWCSINYKQRLQCFTPLALNLFFFLLTSMYLCCKSSLQFLVQLLLYIAKLSFGKNLSFILDNSLEASLSLYQGFSFPKHLIFLLCSAGLSLASLHCSSGVSFGSLLTLLAI